MDRDCSTTDGRITESCVILARVLEGYYGARVSLFPLPWRMRSIMRTGMTGAERSELLLELAKAVTHFDQAKEYARQANRALEIREKMLNEQGNS